MPLDDTYRETFDEPADFLAAIVGQESAGIDDARLEFAAVATGLNSSFPSEGGFLVPDDVAARLWQAVYDTGQIIDRCDRQPVTVGDKLTLPAISETSRADGSRFGGARLYWVEEGETPTATKPGYKAINLHPKKLLGLSYATGALLQDAPALTAWLTRTFGLEAAFTIEDAIVNGTGAGQPLGILNSGALITVAAESGQAAGTIVAANLTNMAGRLWGPSHRSAVWLTSNDGFAQLSDLSFSNGAPVVTYRPDGTRQILGMPLRLTEYTPALGSAGDIVLADFGQYILSERDQDVLASLHLRFLYEEATFRFRYRLDGQPAWSGTITPNNSSTTQSPFITLAARA